MCASEREATESSRSTHEYLIKEAVKSDVKLCCLGQTWCLILCLVSVWSSPLCDMSICPLLTSATAVFRISC